MPYTTDHISVYSQPRPVRIVFLIDVDNCPAEMQSAILDFNLKLWGGRLNLIIPIDKGAIPPGYWNLMRFYDPDVIYSYANISEDMIRKIDIEISPYHFKIHKIIHDDGHKFIPDIRGKFLTVDFSAVPTEVFNPFGDRFLLLICHNRPTWEHYLFFQTNFGIYNDQHMYQPPSELERLVVSEKSSPDAFLEQIADRRRVIYPWQFTVSGVPLKQFHGDRSSLHDCFTVVIGDSVWNWLYMWNKIFLLSAPRRNEINQLYIPFNIIKSESLHPALKKLLSIHAHRCTSHPPDVVFASCDTSEERLSEISKKLTENIDAIPRVRRIACDFDELKDLKDKDWSDYQRFPQHDYVSGNKFYLKPPYPSLKGKLQRGEWIVDFKIEYHPQKYSYMDMSYWWKLPRMSSLSRCFLKNGRGRGRINSDGCLSVIVGGDGSSDLCIRIPDDMNIIRSLLMQDRRPSFTDDVRYNLTSTKHVYDYMQLSDKGRNLNGFLNLFGNLSLAGALVEHHFWRTVFEDMCRVNIQNESNVLRDAKNKLNKLVPNWFANRPSDSSKKSEYFSGIVESLSHLIVRLGRHLKDPSTDITFSRLLRLFEAERQAFIETPGHEPDFEADPQRNKKELLEVLKELTSSKILIQGIKPSCSRCGFQTWYSANEVKFELTCNGCQFEMQIPPQTEWVYRLNSLVQDAIRRHGTFPVIWTLSQLLRQSRGSFISGHCLELCGETDGSILAEVDIACVSDGNFIIGEIKTKASQFSPDEIQKICTIARNVLPQQVVIGAFDPPYDKLKYVAGEIEENLKDLGIQVQIEKPDGWVNNPEPCPYF